jgi:hypothetical protein
MKELDMYPDLIGAIKDGLYKETKNIHVVDTVSATISTQTSALPRMTMLAFHRTPFGTFWNSNYRASNHERPRIVDGCWIISKA